MNKYGFTLVEMLLATVVAGILSTVLFSSLSQVQRSFTFIDFFIPIFLTKSQLQPLEANPSNSLKFFDQL